MELVDQLAGALKKMKEITEHLAITPEEAAFRTQMLGFLEWVLIERNNPARSEVEQLRLSTLGLAIAKFTRHIDPLFTTSIKEGHGADAVTKALDAKKLYHEYRTTNGLDLDATADDEKWAAWRTEQLKTLDLFEKAGPLFGYTKTQFTSRLEVLAEMRKLVKSTLTEHSLAALILAGTKAAEWDRMAYDRLKKDDPNRAKLKELMGYGD